MDADAAASSATAGDGTSAAGSASDTDGNDRGSDGDRLPRTGAAGTVTFGLLGVVLIIGGIAAVLVSRRRKTAQM
ncbi:LPXTG cell wall anchor domain-containing protein [Brevibacterium renqingii]|uniref:LPXTG cell wall anchor domain-containing protein n=1 Tax=Brevibacterium renqingii TaxID=2776916 RepID=UPI00345B29B5